MLKGEAKRQYMKDYMRRMRAGEPTVKPKPPWQPTQRMIDQIAYWARKPRWRRPSDIADRVLDGLTLDNDESWMEACRRYKTLTDERKRERQVEREKEKQPPVWHCLFCNEPTTTKRWFFGERSRIICEVCVDEVAGRKIREHTGRYGVGL